MQYHFVRAMVEDKKVLLEKVNTLKNVADSLKKSIHTEKFSWCRESMGIDVLNNFYANKTTSGRMFGICYIIACACGGEVHLSPSHLTIPVSTFMKIGW